MPGQSKGDRAATRGTGGDGGNFRDGLKPFKNRAFLLGKCPSVNAFSSHGGAVFGRIGSLRIAEIRDSNGVANGVAGLGRARRSKPCLGLFTNSVRDVLKQQPASGSNGTAGVCRYKN